ncbi:uncharacterized protein EI90DRAFT_174368 [Cantharellus anzutake]|uniref:uncharacterized protein n=1 Tax=Cantharellus anzutake TaxID=1750568 RepID=UPI001907286B|nr:uncharacterized protein EI90DRAFT_174368 [Cantharellus anzutake]KAF8336430.1 hypothetical protein EI90DRAFT_174368 [Cantharellus anzutake]
MSAESRVYPRSQRASDFRASRSGRQDSPATDGSPSREDNHRSRPRFRWKAMSNFFREIGNEVRRAGEESSARSVSQSHHVQGGSHSPRDDVSELWGTGSGGTDSRSRDRGSTSRGSQPGRADSDELQTRGRDMTINPIREAAELNIQSQSDRMRQDGYREFKKGTYTYPISFAIPPDSLPSITCPFGNVKYTISATVHRVGTFLPKLTATKEVNVVSCLSPESNEDTGYLLEERQWEEQLCYMIRLEQTHVTIGGVLPVKLTLFPLDKVSIYRIDVVLGEKSWHVPVSSLNLTKLIFVPTVDYYGRTHGIVRHDPVRKYELLSVWQSDTLGPLLPILSNSPSAGRDSPLTPYVCPDNVSPGMMPFASTTSFDRTDEAVTHLLSPTGPWKLRFKLRLPDCSSGFHFTSKSPGALIIVSHMIRLSIRLSAANKLDLQGKPKLFDITVDTPINILSVSTFLLPLVAKSLQGPKSSLPFPVSM